MEALRKKAAAIRLIVFDVDGVMTDGGIIMGANGNEYKIFHAHDGFGLVMLRKAGIYIAVISARTSSIVSERMAALGIELVYQGQSDKMAALLSLMEQLGIDKSATAFVGDDLIDLPAMQQAGLAIAVANARPQVKTNADWVTAKQGGHGAVREICEMLLEARGAMESVQQGYLAAD